MSSSTVLGPRSSLGCETQFHFPDVGPKVPPMEATKKPFNEKRENNHAIGDQGRKKRKENVTSKKKQRKKSRHEIETGPMTIGHLTQGNDVLTKDIIKMASTEDDPPILFDWDAESLTLFWNNAVDYAAGGGGVAIPINGGANLPVAVDINLLRAEILTFVQQGAGNPVPPPGPTIIGNAMGLACSQNQCIICAGFLSRLELHPWFAAVLNVNPITTPLASIWCPRPRNSSGICDQTFLFCVLWE